jgi:hypothetical protein
VGLLRRVSRAHSSVDLSFSKTLAAIGSYNEGTGFQFTSLFGVGPGKILLCSNVIFLCNVFGCSSAGALQHPFHAPCISGTYNVSIEEAYCKRVATFLEELSQRSSVTSTFMVMPPY